MSGWRWRLILHNQLALWERKERMVKEVKKRGKQLGYTIKNIEVVGIPLVKIAKIQSRFFFLFVWTEKI